MKAKAHFQEFYKNWSHFRSNKIHFCSRILMTVTSPSLSLLLSP